MDDIEMIGIMNAEDNLSESEKEEIRLWHAEQKKQRICLTNNTEAEDDELTL